jgi:hypothetical protein
VTAFEGAPEWPGPLASSGSAGVTGCSGVAGFAGVSGSAGFSGVAGHTHPLGDGHTVAYRCSDGARRAAVSAAGVSKGTGTTMPQPAQTGPAGG